MPNFIVDGFVWWFSFFFFFVFKGTLQKAGLVNKMVGEIVNK